MQVFKNYDLSAHNSFGLAAKAAYFIRIDEEAEIPTMVEMAENLAQPLLVLGGGSNMLFVKDFTGVVIHPAIGGIEIEKEDDDHVWVNAGAGVRWHDLVMWSVDKGYGGIENLALIPGTVGAAPIQNIGAYGVELKDVFYKLRGFHLEKGFAEFDHKACGFGYRQSIFKTTLKGKFIVSRVTLQLSKKPQLNTGYAALQEALSKLDKAHFTVSDMAQVVSSIRQSKLPDPSTIGNAGSFFKNPEIDENEYARKKIDYPDMPAFPTSGGQVKISAAWLIEQCGWKGKIVGQTGTYAKHALVLVNHGQAKGSEIWALANEIMASVYTKFGIKLEPEVNIIG
jgi:UDP-N-acetylmuramate dehydrogenase